jgi:uncharacterized membrane protein
MALAITLHELAAVVWVGGMFFAYMALRPAAASLETPLRLNLWAQVFTRFFPWVWMSVILLLISGYGIIFGFYAGMGNIGLHIHLMQGIGIIMMLLFGHIYFGPFRRLKQAVTAQDWSKGGAKLNEIRLLISINLVLGIVVIIIGAGGRYF